MRPTPLLSPLKLMLRAALGYDGLNVAFRWGCTGWGKYHFAVFFLFDLKMQYNVAERRQICASWLVLPLPSTWLLYNCFPLYHTSCVPSQFLLLLFKVPMSSLFWDILTTGFLLFQLLYSPCFMKIISVRRLEGKWTHKNYLYAHSILLSKSQIITFPKWPVFIHLHFSCKKPRAVW